MHINQSRKYLQHIVQVSQAGALSKAEGTPQSVTKADLLNVLSSNRDIFGISVILLL